MAKITDFILNCLRESYGLDMGRLERLAWGADIQASVYRAEGADRTVYFVKVRQGSFSKAFIEVMSLLQQAGIREIIAPIRTREGQQVLTVGDLSLMVYPYIEGENGFNSSLSDQQWMLFGQTLRRIHDIEVPEAVQKHIRREGFSSKWRDFVRSLYSQIQGESDDVGAAFREYLIVRRETIEELLYGAERLSKEVEKQALSFVLCHSDIHAGNLLLETQGSLYLVDWDDPIMAPKERDLMFIGGGVGNVWNRPHEEKLFYDGYGETVLNPVLVGYYRHERILEDIVDYAQELLPPNKSSSDRAEMYSQFVAMFAPRGVVDIALHGDKRLF